MREIRRVSCSSCGRSIGAPAAIVGIIRCPWCRKENRVTRNTPSTTDTPAPRG